MADAATELDFARLGRNALRWLVFDWQWKGLALLLATRLRARDWLVERNALRACSPSGMSRLALSACCRHVSTDGMNTMSAPAPAQSHAGSRNDTERTSSANSPLRPSKRNESSSPMLGIHESRSVSGSFVSAEWKPRANQIVRKRGHRASSCAQRAERRPSQAAKGLRARVVRIRKAIGAFVSGAAVCGRCPRTRGSAGRALGSVWVGAASPARWGETLSWGDPSWRNPPVEDRERGRAGWGSGEKEGRAGRPMPRSAPQGGSNGGARPVNSRIREFLRKPTPLASPSARPSGPNPLREA